MDESLKPEDYQEPRCLLDMTDPSKAPSERIPIFRVLEKLDEHLFAKDFAGAERLLDYWEKEAIRGGDIGGRLSVLSEKMGFFRNQNRREEAFDALNTALTLVEKHGLDDSLMAGGAFLNAGTVCKAFGEAMRAVELYDKAKAIYEKHLPSTDERLGGLYNNRGLALTDVGRFDEAKESFEKALHLMGALEHKEAELAVTMLNLASLSEARDGLEAGAEEIARCCETAMRYLDTPDLPHGGMYAFHCEKCASTFDYYGYFAYAMDLRKRISK